MRKWQLERSHRSACAFSLTPFPCWFAAPASRIISSTGLCICAACWATNRSGFSPFRTGRPDLDHEGSVADPPGTLARQALLFALNLWPNHAADLWAPPDGIFHATKLLHPPRRLRLTATLHDMTCWLLPELHQPANVAAEKRFAERIWKRAAGL